MVAIVACSRSDSFRREGARGVEDDVLRGLLKVLPESLTKNMLVVILFDRCQRC